MTTTQSGSGYLLNPQEGRALWFLGTLMTLKAGGEQTGGAFTLLECLMPPGFAPPPHVHRAEDEGFYLLEGDLTVTCGAEQWRAGPGAFVWLPRGLPHGFTVEGTTPARMLQVTAPAGFERFAAEVGQPAQTPVLPPPAAPAIERLLASAARHQIEILGPPPAR